MSLPKISIDIANGGIGGTLPNTDSISGLIFGSPAIAGITHGEPFLLNSLAELLEKTGEQGKTTALYKEVSSFYKKAKPGRRLYIITFANDEVVSDHVDIADESSSIFKLMEYAKGEIKQLGINIVHEADYKADNEDKGIDSDILTGVGKLSIAKETMMQKFAPFVSIIGGIGYNGDVTTLVDITGRTDSSVSVVLSAESTDGLPSVGLALGQLAAIPVCDNIGKVKLGAIAEKGYMTDGKDTHSYSTKWEAIHNKGYIFMRSFTGKEGVFFNFDSTATKVTDDYAQLSRNRVIFKAVRIAYTTYIDELLSSVELQADGTMQPSKIAYFEGLINNAVALNMQNELSAFRAKIDPKQNVIQTGLLKVVLRIVPLGQLKKINVNLGFTTTIEN